MLRASRRLATRGYATAHGADFSARTTVYESVKPTASVTFVLDAGARFEPKPGAAHVLSNFAFTSNDKRSTLRTVREAELYGGLLSATLGREHLSLTAEFLRGDEAHFVDVLARHVAGAHFARHELSESVLPAVAAESAAAAAAPGTHALELAHALAFRSGLGNALYATPAAAHHVTVQDVAALHAAAAPSLRVFGAGVSEDALVSALNKSLAELGKKGQGFLASTATAAAPPASKYYGGSTRVATDGPSALVLAFGSTDASAVPALHALAAHLSPAPALKWSAGLGPLAPSLAPGVSVRAVALPYSDAALLALVIEGPAGQLAGAGKAAVEGLKAAAGGLGKEDASRALARARFQIAAAGEGVDGAVAALANGQAAGAVAEAVAALDGAAISKVAESLVKGKATFVAVGETAVLPYADEIGLSNA